MNGIEEKESNQFKSLDRNKQNKIFDCISVLGYTTSTKAKARMAIVIIRARERKKEAKEI